MIEQFGLARARDAGHDRVRPVGDKVDAERVARLEADHGGKPPAHRDGRIREKRSEQNRLGRFLEAEQSHGAVGQLGGQALRLGHAECLHGDLPHLATGVDERGAGRGDRDHHSAAGRTRAGGVGTHDHDVGA